MENRVAFRSKQVSKEIIMIETASAITGRSDVKAMMVGAIGVVVSLANDYVQKQVQKDGNRTFNIFERVAIISNYVEPTRDNDIAIVNGGAEKLASKLESKHRAINLVDAGKKVGGTITGSTTTQEKYSPFYHYSIDKMPEIDCFEKTIGPIRFTEGDLDSARSVTIKSDFGSFLTKIASSKILIATNLNPLTITEQRLKKGMLVVLSEAEKLGTGEEFLQKVVKPAARKIKEGELVIAEMIENIQASDSMMKTYAHVLVSDEYVSYGKYVRKTIPNKIEYATGKILNIASKLEIGDRDTNRKAIAIFVEELRR